MGLGSYPAVGLGEARDTAQANVKTAKTGLDPRKPNASAPTPTPAPAPVATPAPAPSAAPMFADFAATVIPMRTQTLTNEQSVETWYTSLAKHVYPTIGAMPVGPNHGQRPADRTQSDLGNASAHGQPHPGTIGADIRLRPIL